MIRIAIDGACRRNGKPDCVSSGGVFIKHFDNELTWVGSKAISVSEERSTNQRGELLALKEALKYTLDYEEQVHIITDSEYIFNTMTKEWYRSWVANGWLTAAGTQVKNYDIWSEIVALVDMCDADVTYYHIKGHVIPFGKATASKIMEVYPNGTELYVAACDKYDDVYNTSRAKQVEEAQELSAKNNGFVLPDHIIKEFVAMNTVVDAIATIKVEAADREI